MVNGIVVCRRQKPSKVSNMQNPENIHKKIPEQLTVIDQGEKKTNESRALYVKEDIFSLYAFL